MTRIAPLAAVILASSLLTLAAAEAPALCPWAKVLRTGEAHFSFLRRGSPSPRLYHSAWSAERALLSCAWSDDAPVIQSYLSACQGRAQGFSERAAERFDVESVLGSEEQCVPLPSLGAAAAHPGRHGGKRPVRSVGGPPAAENSQGQEERSGVRTHMRVKRGFIVPGTLWCGSGNKAPSYENLGVFADTDSCCREHDQCKNTILSFHSDFGVFNSNIFTMSHCDCDNKFRTCLSEANDSISDVVGYTFFNLLKMHCFEFSHQLQCTQRNWFGMCKESKMALYAEVHPPTPYESTNPTEASINSTHPIISTTTPAELPESSTLDPKLSSISVTATTSTVPTPSAGSPSASLTPATNVAISTVTNVSERRTLPEKRDDLENTLSTKNRTVTEQDADRAETQASCDIYKDLDECRNKILPQQKKYGLHNPEPRMLYHCNCTTRLFQTLVKQTHLTEVQALLLGHVSQSCFLSQDCTAGKICTATLVRADLPQLYGGSSAVVEEERHLQAVKLKIRRPSTRRAKRKDRAVRLHKLCLRLTRPKLINKTRRLGQNAQRPSVGGSELIGK